MNIHISAIILSRKRIQPCPLILVGRSVVRRSVFITILCRLRSGEVLKAFRKNIRYFFGGRQGKSVFRGLCLYDRDVVFSYHSLDALFRVYDGDHLQVVSDKKVAERCLIQMLRGCDHVGAHNVLDLLVAGRY